MGHILTALTENIFVVIGFTLYCGLVYYMISKAIRKHYGHKKNKKSRSAEKTSRKDFSKNVLPGNKISGNDFS